MQSPTLNPVQLKFFPSSDLPMNNLGQINLKAIRTGFNLDQKEFADLIGVPENTYISWEIKRRNPSRSAVSLLKIAAAYPDIVKRVLGTNVDFLVEENGMIASA